MNNILIYIFIALNLFSLYGGEKYIISVNLREISTLQLSHPVGESYAIAHVIHIFWHHIIS